MKKTFILYTDICKGALKMLSKSQAGLLFNMIIDYADAGVAESGGDATVDIAFSIIRATIDANSRSYEEVCEKRRESGRKGALVTNSKKRQMTANADKSGKVQQMPTSSANADKSGKNGMIYNDMICNDIKDSNESYDNIRTNSNELESSCELDFPRLLEFFNSQLKEKNSLIPSIKQLSDARKKMLKARMREFGKEALVSVFMKASVSDFLNGKNNRNFIASFDWLLKPTNFPKVLEGNYDNPVNTKASDPLTANANGLLEQVKQEQQQREEEQRRRIISLYNAAKDGDERSIAIVEQMRKNGILGKYNME